MSNAILDLEAGDGCVLMIDGKRVPLKDWKLEISNPAVQIAPKIDRGKFEVSGEITAYFTDSAALDEYFRRDAELVEYFRSLVAEPEPPRWHRWVRLGLKVAIVLALLTLTTGAS